MPAKYTHDIVATIGKYKDRQPGEEKKNYLTVGKCFTDEQGRQSLKIEAMPVTPEWSGWLSLYPAKERQPQDRMPEGRQQQRSMPPAPTTTAANHDDDNESLPF